MKSRKPNNLLVAISIGCLFAHSVGFSTVFAEDTAATTGGEASTAPADPSAVGGGSTDANSCPAVQNSPKVITEYVKNLEKALDKIRAKAMETPGCSQVQTDTVGTRSASGSTGTGGTPIDPERLANKAVDRASRFGESVIATINDAVTISNFDTTAQYYVGLALDSDIPNYVQRDDAVLGRQQAKITAASKTVYNRCQEEVVLPAGSIPGIDTDITLGAAIDRILKNQIRLKNYYRTVVIDNVSDSDKEPFLLVGDDPQFRADMKLNYARTGKEACRTEEPFWKRISEAIERIGKLGGKIGEGIRDWEAAWAMLNNADSLAAGQQGVGRISISVTADGISIGGGMSVSNRNVLKYNNEPEAFGMGSTLRNIGRKVSGTIDAIESQYARIREQLKNPGNTERYARLVEALRAQQETNSSLADDYQVLRTLVGKNNAVISENVTGLIRMHQSLVAAEKTIREAIPIAERVCNDQATGKGNCSYR